MKTCFKCNVKKDLIEFYRHKEMADGYLNKCKECTKKDNTNHRNNNIDYYREYEKERAILPHRIEARKRYSKTAMGIVSKRKAIESWVKKNKNKRIAHNILNNALRNGQIIKSNKCQLCGCESHRLEGHHYDYNEPLNVTWLCSKCHSIFHKTSALSNYVVNERN